MLACTPVQSMLSGAHAHGIVALSGLLRSAASPAEPAADLGGIRRA